MSQIRVRQILGINNEPQWGQGQANFLTDLQAVAQLVYTRLLLFQGEWWNNKGDGLPLWQSMLGVPSSQPKIALLIEQRILGTPFVTGISNVQTSYNSGTRKFTFSAQVITQFGTFVVVNSPMAPNGALP